MMQFVFDTAGLYLLNTFVLLLSQLSMSLIVHMAVMSELCPNVHLLCSLLLMNSYSTNTVCGAYLDTRAQGFWGFINMLSLMFTFSALWQPQIIALCLFLIT